MTAPRDHPAFQTTRPDPAGPAHQRRADLDVKTTDALRDVDNALAAVNEALARSRDALRQASEALRKGGSVLESADPIPGRLINGDESPPLPAPDWPCRDR